MPEIVVGGRKQKLVFESDSEQIIATPKAGAIRGHRASLTGDFAPGFLNALEIYGLSVPRPDEFLHPTQIRADRGELPYTMHIVGAGPPHNEIIGYLLDMTGAIGTLCLESYPDKHPSDLTIPYERAGVVFDPKTLAIQGVTYAANLGFLRPNADPRSTASTIEGSVRTLIALAADAERRHPNLSMPCQFGDTRLAGLHESMRTNTL